MGRKEAPRWAKIALQSGIAVASVAAGVAIAEAMGEPVAAQATTLGESVDLSGMTETQVREEVERWWSEASAEPIPMELAHPGFEIDVTLADLSATLDVDATVEQVVFLGTIARRLDSWGKPEQVSEVRPVIGLDPENLVGIADVVAESVPAPKPASVTLDAAGEIVRTPEVPGLDVAIDRLGERIVAWAMTGESVEVPLVASAKRLSDEDLAKIDGIVGRFETRFNSGQRNRSSNIRLAAGELDGVLLMPGEEMSFNETVGERTSARGYKSAGVIVNGRMDVGIGGGICQVSTTLYNAALKAGMGVVSRRNHSVPVPYVRPGQDAAVDYGSIDLVLRNDTDAPVALVSRYEPGRLSFYVLGDTVEGREVELIPVQGRAWSVGEQVVQDASLGYGETKVVESGALARTASLVRVIRENGVEVSRETVADSRYVGRKRIVARNDAAEPEPEPEPESTNNVVDAGETAPVEMPEVVPPLEPLQTSG